MSAAVLVGSAGIPRCYKGRLTAESDAPVGTALVTGAAGFIGVHLVERLLGLGGRVRGLDDERSGDWSRVDPGVERVAAALESLDDGALDMLFEGVDVLFHLAAEKYNSSRATPETVFEVNVDATRRLFAAAARARRSQGRVHVVALRLRRRSGRSR